MEGRFYPGEDESLDWNRVPSIAFEEMKEKKRGGLVYFYDERDAAEGVDPKRKADAKHAQNDVLFEPEVRRYAKKLVAVIADAQYEKDAAVMKRLGLSKTPAIAVLDPECEVVARFEGHIEAGALAAALSQVAPEKKKGGK
jgi:hypothetical protein